MKQRMSILATLAAVVGAAGLFWTSIGSAAEAAGDAAARGSSTYRIYCGSCHGKTGKGDGKLAESLRQPPADLTQLAKRNGGVFAAEKVREAIDGRHTVAAHGESDMPVWGLSFRPPTEEGAATKAESTQEAEVQAKLDDLVAFLRSLQVK